MALEITDLPSHPLTLFSQWYTEACEQKANAEPNAMILSTVSKNSLPSSRVVLLKHFDDNGFIFYTNFSSRKSCDLLDNPNVSLLFWWPTLNQQIRIEGKAEKVAAEISDAYFQSRPRESQIAASISPQSQTIPNREYLEQHYLDLYHAEKGKPLKRPENWGGYSVIPHYFEYWQRGDHRLHDRYVYRLIANKWQLSRLAP